MAQTKPFPLNAWYAAAWGHEIEHELAARTICEKDIVLYRRSDGEVAALEDACWHRLLPLSLGQLEGDEVVCGYHGLVFNAAGRCTYMPAQKTINPSACVRAYPVVERHRLVWVWPGDPALADPAKVPDFHWNDGTEWVGEGGTFYSLKCDYRLVIDNLMDLTHETYVHAGSIGDEAITSTPFDVTHTDRTATVTRWMIDIEPPPFWAKQLGRPGHVDRWQIIYFQAPSIVVGDVGVALTGTGAPQGDRSQGVNGCFLAAITPETEKTCHYFWNFVRTFRTRRRAAHPRHQARPRQRRQGRLRPGPRGPRGAAEGDRQEPAHAVLQPQHRCRRPVGAPHDRPHARGRGRPRPCTCRASGRVGRACAERDRMAERAGCAPSGTSRPTSASSRSSRRGSSCVPTPGSHINVTVQIGDRPDVRSYSIVGPCDGRPLPDRGEAPARTRRGGSAYMWSLEPGARLTISTPGNHFELGRGRPEYLLLAGGIGITPIYTMALALARGAAPTSACSTPAGAGRTWRFADELRERIGERLQVLRRRGGRAGRSRGRDRAARAGAASSTSAARSACWRRPSASGSESGRPVDRLRFETFGNSGRFASEPFNVRIPRLGRESRCRRTRPCWRRWRRPASR